jgi:hypothetical protein
MKADLTTDVRIIALQSAILRTEHLINEGIITEPILRGQIKAMVERLKREMNILKLNQQSPGI